jgi:hypothetical protein
MSLTKSTAGDDFLRDYNIKPYKLQAAYTPAVGDLVKLSTTAADAVARCASTDLPFGIVISINSSNGTVSVAELDAGVTLILEYTSTAPTLGQKVYANGDRGTVFPGRDRVLQNAGGNGVVVAVDSSSPAGTGTVVARFP